MKTKEIGLKLKEDLGLKYFPIGVMLSDIMPENAKKFVKKGNGCVTPLIFSSAKGKTTAMDKDTTGWPCSAFYLGYQDWIYPGIECFLSDGVGSPMGGERFIKTPNQAKAFVASFIPKEIHNKVTVFKPLEQFNDDENPEIAIFFVTPDELSGLVYLLHFNSPDVDDTIVTRFNSGCSSIVTLPMRYKIEGKMKAVMGMHDINARLRLPKDILTLSMPINLVKEICSYIDDSFIKTENWNKIKERNQID